MKTVKERACPSQGAVLAGMHKADIQCLAWTMMLTTFCYCVTDDSEGAVEGATDDSEDVVEKTGGL
jgi:hypothetical protein